VVEQSKRWTSAEKEALRQRFLSFRAEQEANGDFNLKLVADDTDVPYDILKGFARDPEMQKRASMPRSMEYLDAIDKYLQRFGYIGENAIIASALSHPEVVKLFARSAPKEHVLESADYRGLYVGMAVERRSPKLIMSVLGIAEREDVLYYAEHDANTAVGSSMEGQCFLIGGKLVLLGVSRDIPSVQFAIVRGDSMLTGGKQVLVGAEYHTGWPGRGSSAARAVFVQISKDSFEGDLMEALVKSEAFSHLLAVQSYEELPEDVTWERVGEALAQMIGNDAAVVATEQARKFIGPFEYASDVV